MERRNVMKDGTNEERRKERQKQRTKHLTP
jgi:hypothetical protein